MRPTNRLISLIMIAWLLGCSQATTVPFSALTAQDWSPSVTQVIFPEPSGIAYHPQRGTLFVVGDEGDVGEISIDGTLLQQTNIQSFDFEGVTYNPVNQLLYLVVEGDNKIIAVDPETLSLIQAFSIDPIFNGELVLSSGNNGLEGITFIPDDTSPDGGVFYLVHQNGVLDLESSMLIQVDFPTGSSDVKITDVYPIAIADLSGLHYDVKSNNLFAISGSESLVLHLTLEGEVQNSFPLPGRKQEGFVNDDDNVWYIAQDFGTIMKTEAQK